MTLIGSSRDVARAWIQGDMLCILIYGMNIVLFVAVFTRLRKRSAIYRRKGSAQLFQTTILEIYNAVLFSLCSISSITKMAMMQSAYVDHTDYIASDSGLSGSGAYQEHLYTSFAIGMAGNAACAITNWMVACLLICRCYVIYRNSKTAIWCLVLFPGALLAASFVSGIVYLHAIHDENESPFNARGHSIAITYGAICLMLNLVLTFMITTRLLLYRRSITKLVGAEYARQYTSIISILIESGSILDITVVSIVILVAVSSPWIALPLLSLTEVEAIAAFMILIRMAKGTAWSSGTANELIAQHATARRPSETEIGSAISPFRINSQMTQMSAAFDFNHPHTISTILLTKDAPNHLGEKGSPGMVSSLTETGRRASTSSHRELSTTDSDVKRDNEFDIITGVRDSPTA